MKLTKREPLEKTIQAGIRRALERANWLVEKTHGNRFQVGWPDLFISHSVHGQKWVEVKRPKKGRLTPGQRSKFQKWSDAGVGIWILTSADDLSLLDDPPNWREWL